MKKIDPESQALWDEFRKACDASAAPIQRENRCCITARAAIKWGFTYVGFVFGSNTLNLKMNYCPECGRKL